LRKKARAAIPLIPPEMKQQQSNGKRSFKAWSISTAAGMRVWVDSVIRLTFECKFLIELI